MISPDDPKNLALKEMASRMRRMALDMALASGQNGAHLGGGLSCMEILAVLYGDVLRFDPKRPQWPDRDRFLPSKNHCVLAHFPAMAECGILPKEELMDFQKDGGRLTGYPLNPDVGLEYSGGSLGMAISVAIGLAVAAREDQKTNRFYVLMGDGELNEGSIWEAFMSAPHFGLDNLTAVIDRNHLCYDGDTEDVMPLDDLAAKLRSFNWNTVVCDGHDIVSLRNAFRNTVPGKPSIILAETVKGKGVSFMEQKHEWHHSRLSAAQYEQAVAELEHPESRS